MMEKLTMQSKNRAEENFKKLVELFPNAVTETIDENGEVVRAIDKDVLMQEISNKVVEGRDERYQFSWPDKKKSVLLANAPISKTLRPCREESVNFDTTGNLYIEGDNLDVLKLLEEVYLNRIKVIYIDPPYNTGNDFIYKDKFSKDVSDFLLESGQVDEQGNQFVTNKDTNGRFHTDWLNMIYPRLKLAKNLLSDDGAIFISIDDNEQANLKKICDEVFGATNFVATFKWNRTAKAPSLAKSVRIKYEYVLCYKKNKDLNLYGKKSYNSEAPLLNVVNKTTIIDFPVGSISANSSFEVGKYSEKYDVSLLTPLEIKNGFNALPVKIQAKFKWTQNTVNNYLETGRKFIIKKSPATLYYQLPEEASFIPPADVINDDECNVKKNTDASADLQKMGIAFDYSKPVSLVKYLVNSVTYCSKEAIILDFFSGSASTAQAVMELNAEDGGSRKFIMVQLPEMLSEEGRINNPGFETICCIGKERIRRSGKTIKSTDGLELQDLDVGFRVLKIDSSNMKDIFYEPNNVEQLSIESLETNIKEDRTGEDLLFQVMLELGLPLSSKIEESLMGDCKVFNVAEGFLYACFDGKISNETVSLIANKKPHYVVLRDSGIDSDSVLTNFDQIFESISPSTVRKVL